MIQEIVEFSYPYEILFELIKQEDWKLISRELENCFSKSNLKLIKKFENMYFLLIKSLFEVNDRLSL